MKIHNLLFANAVLLQCIPVAHSCATTWVCGTGGAIRKLYALDPLKARNLQDEFCDDREDETLELMCVEKNSAILTYFQCCCQPEWVCGTGETNAEGRRDFHGQDFDRSCFDLKNDESEAFCVDKIYEETTYTECCCEKDKDQQRGFYSNLVHHFSGWMHRLFRGEKEKGGANRRLKRLVSTEGKTSDCNEETASNKKAEPWLEPNLDNAQLVAADPGIWIVENYMSDDMADKAMTLIGKYGDDLNLLKRCHANSHSHLDDKTCMRLYPDRMAESQADAVFISDLMDKIKATWIEGIEDEEETDFMGVQRVRGGCNPMLFHTDATKHDAPGIIRTVTFIIYLTDSNVETYFPHANVSIVPKKGLMATWLNTHADGTINHMAIHGVQAAPSNSTDRVMLNYHLTTAAPDMVRAAVARG